MAPYAVSLLGSGHAWVLGTSRWEGGSRWAGARNCGETGALGPGLPKETYGINSHKESVVLVFTTCSNAPAPTH